MLRGWRVHADEPQSRRRSPGDLADAITFSSAEELAKTNHFLDADHERRDLTRQIQAVIREKFTASALYARTVPKALSALKGHE
jgi:hypothetical protein